MTDHRVSDFVFKKSNHVGAPAFTHPVKATSETMRVNPLLLLQQYISLGTTAENWYMSLSMSYVFILQHYLRQLEPCYNPANQLKQIH